DEQSGAMEYYRQHMKHGSATGRSKHCLIMGPWDHLGTRTPKREVGGLTFGEASVVDLNLFHRQWHDWTMKGAHRPDFLKKRIACYVTEAEEWRYGDSLEDFQGGIRTLYLASDNGRANEVFESGRLVEDRPPEAPPDRYTYDPL